MRQVHNIFTTIAAAFLEHVIGKQHAHLAAPLVQVRRCGT